MNAQRTVGRRAVLLVGLLLLAGCGSPKEQQHVDVEWRVMHRLEKSRYYGGSLDPKCIAELTETIRGNPKNAEVYYCRGAIHHLIGDAHDKAIADLSEAIRLNLKDAEAYFARGLAHLVQARAKALAILLDDPNAEAEAEEARQPEREKAIADFTEVIRQNPNDAQAYYCRGLTHLRKGDQDKAAADLAKAKQLGFWPVDPGGNRNFFKEYPALKEQLTNSGTSQSK